MILRTIEQKIESLVEGVFAHRDRIDELIGTYAVGWSLDAAQVARLDEASAVTPAYPYWHQKGFAERNPPPV